MDEWAALDKCSKIGLVGAAAVFISVFLPLVNIFGMSISMFEANKLAAAIVLVISAYLGYSVVKKDFKLLPAGGTGFVLISLSGFLAYIYMLNKMKGDFFGQLTSAAFGLNVGLALLVAGGLAMVYAGISGKLIEARQQALIEAQLRAWKEALFQDVKLANVVLPGWILSVIMTVLIDLILYDTQLH